MLDFAIRAGVGILLLAVGSVIVGGVKKGCAEQRGAKFKIIMSDYNYEQIKKIIGDIFTAWSMNHCGLLPKQTNTYLNS